MTQVRTTFSQKFSERLASLTESEVLNELSDDTLSSYSKKAREQEDAIKKRLGPKSKANKAILAKREDGRKKAGETLYKRHVEKKDQHLRMSHAAFKEAAHKALTDHGYELAHPGKASNVYTKHEPETNSMHVAKHHFGTPGTSDSYSHQNSEVSIASTNGTTSRVTHSGFSATLGHRDGKTPDYHARHYDNIKTELERHHRYHNESTFRGHLNEDAEVEGETLEEGDKPRLRPYQSPVRKKWIEDQKAKEAAVKEDTETPEVEPEQIDELSKSKMAAYVVAASKDAAQKRYKAADDLGKATRNPSDFERKNAESEKSFNDGSKRLKGIEKASKKLAEETLEEGRGRPRKDGTSAVGADREHIIMQLRKNISLRGANPVEFADGSKHNISQGHARLALTLHNTLKTSQEKGHFTDKLDASHESFHDALKNKETAGHAPPEKSRITLPAMDRLKAKMAAES